MIGQEAYQRARGNPVVRRVAQGIIVLLLLTAGWQFNERLGHEESQTAAVNAILARSCGAASFKQLRNQGLIEECMLAQKGDLAEAIPDDALPKPGAAPSDVDPDVVQDDNTSTPADLAPGPLGPSDPQVLRGVEAYFDLHPLGTQEGYQRAVQRATVAYLTENPPAPGRPPTDREIRSAVRVALVANPPADGVDGADGSDGRGVAAASIDGCDVVFTYSDGATDRVGPLCGADGAPGPAPSDQQVADAVAAYCSANGECRGPQGPQGEPGVVQTSDNCEPANGEYVTDVNISGPEGDPATITITCTTEPFLGLGNAG